MKALLLLKLCIILFSGSYVYGRHNFYVEKSGHSQVKPGEISVVFYMTVANGGKKSIKVYSKNVQCCWIHPGSFSMYDCESMDLLGGIALTLEPSKTGNVTYIFTNLYPMDRVGKCVFHLWHDDDKIAHTIRFNTTYTKDLSWLRSLYNTITGKSEEYKVCSTMDLDPRRKCKPVNCVQKYNGKRNYFRKGTKMCEPVHECFTERDKDDLPTTAFDKDHNKCKSLIQKELSADEERHLKKDVEKNLDASQKEKFKPIGANDPYPVKCNHGQRVGDICVCEDGWKTDASNVPLGDPKFIYNWCNVKTRKKPLLPYKHQKYFMIVGLSLTSFTMLVAWIWMLYRYCYLYYQQDIKDKPQPQKPILKDKTRLIATNQLLKELESKNILKRKREEEAKGVLYAARTSEETTPIEHGTAGKKLSAEAMAVSFIDDKNVVCMTSKAVQNGRSTLSSIKQTARNRSTFSRANEEDSVALARSSEMEGKNTTSSIRQTPKGLSTYSLAGDTSTVSVSGKPMEDDRGSTWSANQTTKGRSTYSLAGDAKSVSFFGNSTLAGDTSTTSSGKPMKDDDSTWSANQTSKGRSTYSFAGDAKSVSFFETSTPNNRRTISSASQVSEGRSDCSRASPASNVSLNYAESAASNASLSGRLSKQDRHAVYSVSQLVKDPSPYSMTADASSDSDSEKAMKSDRSTSMSLITQSPKDHSTYSLNAGERSRSTFTGSRSSQKSMVIPVHNSSSESD